MEARVFAKVGLARLLLRFAIVMMSGVAGLLAAVAVVRWIPGAPLAGGGYEATPVHVAGFFGTWVFVALVGGVLGNCVFRGASVAIASVRACWPNARPARRVTAVR